MPGAIDGRGLATLARSKQPGIKVVYASGFPGRQSSAGIDVNLDAPLIMKPYRKSDLERVLDEVLMRPDAATLAAAEANERLRERTGQI